MLNPVAALGLKDAGRDAPADGAVAPSAQIDDWKKPSAAAAAAAQPPLFRRPLFIGGVALLTAACATGIALGVLRPWQTPASAAVYSPSADTLAVRAHVAAQIATCKRPAQGNLTFPYLIPAGGYDQLWCVHEERTWRGGPRVARVERVCV